MTREEQKHFIQDLTSNVTTRLVEAIETGKIPASWDGHQLRQLLADSYKSVVWIKMSTKDMKEYRNVVLTHNL